MANDSELLIKIRMLLEGREAASQATAAIKETKAATEAASTATTAAATAQTSAATSAATFAKETSKTNLELKDLSKYGAAGSQILQGLNRAASGGLINALLGTGSAIRGVVAAAGINPFAGFIAAIVGAGGLIAALVKLRTGAHETQISLEQMKAAADDLVQTRLDDIEAGFRAQGEAIDSNTRGLQLQLELQQRIAAAQAQANIATIQANPALDERTRADLIAQQEQSVRLAAAANELERERIRARDAEARATDATREVATITAQRDKALSASLNIQRRRSEVPAERERLVKESNAVTQERQKVRLSSDPNSSEFIAADAQLAARTRDINRRLDDLDELFSETIDTAKKGFDDGVDKLDAAIAAAESRRIALKNASDEARRRLQQVEAALGGPDQPGTILGEGNRGALANAGARAFKDEVSGVGASAARRAHELSELDSVKQSPDLQRIIAALGAAGERLAKNPTEENLEALKAPVRGLFAEAEKAGSSLADDLVNAARVINQLLARFSAPPAPEPRAKGGPVRRGKRYIVGEQGEEEFVPASDGKVIPSGETAVRERAMSENRAPTPPAPPNPPGSGFTNLQWRDYAHANPGEARSFAGSEAGRRAAARGSVIHSNAEALERGREQNRARGIEGAGDTSVGDPASRVINSNAEAQARTVQQAMVEVSRTIVESNQQLSAALKDTQMRLFNEVREIRYSIPKVTVIR